MKANFAKKAADTAFTCSALLFVFLHTLASAAPTLVVSDTSWKASDHPPADWAAADCDDSRWAEAKDYGLNEEKWKHYTVDNTFGFASEGNWIWTKADAGGCVRKKFKAPEKFATAEMIFVADDTAEIWINGEKVDFYDTSLGFWGYRGCAVIVDVLPWIADGDNVVAVKLVDTGGARGFACEIRFDGEPLAKPFAAGAKDADFQEPGGEDLFKFHTIDAKGLKDLFNAGNDHQQVSVRWLAAAAALGAKDAPGLDKALRAAEDGNDRLSERAVRFIDALALKSHADTLVEVLKAKPATRSGAFAAAALARLGNADAVPALEAASSCGFGPTERAAKRALAALKK